LAFFGISATFLSMIQALGVRRFVLFAAALAATAVAMAGWSASSKADVYCVAAASQPGCDTFNASLQTELSAAAIHPGPDEVQVYPDTYTGNFTYQNLLNSTNTVEIRGMGTQPSQTVLKISNHTGLADALSISAPAGSSVNNIEFRLDADTDTNSDAALDVAGENGGNVTIEDVMIDGPHSSNATGIRCGNCLVKDSAIDLTSDGMYSNSGVRQDGGPATIENSSIVAHDGFTHSSPNERSLIERSRITAHIGASTDGGFIDIRDSLIKLDDQTGAIGVNFYNGNAGTSAMGGDLDGVTIVNGAENGGTYSSTGIRARVDDPGESVDANVTNSVISGFTYPFGAAINHFQDADDMLNPIGGPLSFTIDYSALSSGAVSHGIPDGYVPGPHNVDLLNVDPGYVNPASDFSPAPGSPLLDAGNPADPAPGTTDIDGNPRACHGTDAGVIRRDIGASEHRTKVGADLDDCTYPETTIDHSFDGGSFGSNYVEVPIASSKPNSAFFCSVDGGSASLCNAPLGQTGLFKSTGLSDGAFTLSATARDEFGNIDQTPDQISFQLYDGTGETCATNPELPGCDKCENNPAVCPKPDRTAPKVTSVKAPKKTNAKRVKVRFKSNEKGSTFKCRLNKGKWKKCKSPWKTPKLRKGRNVVKIQATDKAGNKSKVVTRTINKIPKQLPR